MKYFAQFSTAVEVCDYSTAAYKYVRNPSLQTRRKLFNSALSLCASHVDHLRVVVLITAIVVVIGALPAFLRWIYR